MMAKRGPSINAPRMTMRHLAVTKSRRHVSARRRKFDGEGRVGASGISGFRVHHLYQSEVRQVAAHRRSGIHLARRQSA